MVREVETSLPLELCRGDGCTVISHHCQKKYYIYFSFFFPLDTRFRICLPKIKYH